MPGNHDSCWQGHKKGHRQSVEYLDTGGIARIVDNPKSVVLAGEEVQINHFPYNPNLVQPVRFAQWQPKDDGGWLLCGHIHGLWRQHRKQINVGLDAWNFTPVSDDTIATMIAAGPARIPCPTYTHSIARRAHLNGGPSIPSTQGQPPRLSQLAISATPREFSWPTTVRAFWIHPTSWCSPS